MQRPATSRPAKPVRAPAPAAAPRTAAAKAEPLSRPDQAEFNRARAAATRISLAAAFALLTIIGVTLSITSGLTVWAAVVCGALTGAVLVAGRRAVVVERRRTRSRMPDAVARPAPGTAGRAPAGQASVGRAPAGQAARPSAKTAKTARPSARAADSGQESHSRDGQSTGAHLEARASDGRAASSSEARRPGVSGRVTGGRTVYHLPESVEIRPVEAAPEPRRFTPSRPARVAPPAPESAPVAQPKPARAPGGVPAPTYTMMPGAPKWEPKALTALDYAHARDAATRATRQAAAEALAEGVETAATGEIRIPGRVVFSEDAIDLDRAIAARRRAAGR